MTGRLFQMIGDINSVIAILQQFPATDSDDLYLQTVELGSDLGKIMRSVYNLSWFQTANSKFYLI